MPQPLDTAWVLICAALVFFMQAGFICLESGLVRSKNAINTTLKNLMDVCLAGVVFWAFSHGIMFGDSAFGLFGSSGFLFAPSQPHATAVFLFQLMFCTTAVTVISGAVAERMSFRGYLVVTAIVALLIYPIFGHWAWAQPSAGSTGGWLLNMGFIDFSGATVVHSTGGWVALAAILVIGPRTGRFSANAPPIIGHSLPTAGLGVMILWLGWIGFTGGNFGAMNGKVPGIILNTTLAAMFGGLTAMGCSCYRYGHARVVTSMMGIIAGLVSITAAAHIIGPGSAALIGAIAGVLAFATTYLLIHLKIDDVVAVFPTHGVAGIWGTLAVALLGDSSDFASGGRVEQFGIQLLGVATCAAWAFGLSYLLLKLIHHRYPLRVSAKDEYLGLNTTEHGANTELVALLHGMEDHQQGPRAYQSVAVEPHTEIGQIARQYNRVLSSVRQKEAELAHVNEHLEETVVRRTADLADSNEKLSRSNEELDQFTRIAAHDLKEPLRKIASFGSLLQRREGKALSEDGQSYINRMCNATERMQSLIESILCYSRVEKNDRDDTAVDLNVLAQDILSDLTSNMPPGATINIAPLPTINANRTQMTQLLQNLMANAIKFHRPDTPPQVSVQGSVQGDVCTLVVEDNGIGIADEHRDKVFGMFQRLNPLDQYEGSGMGLAICKKLVEQQGGSIDFVSKPGQGTRFEVNLPITPAP